MSGRTSRYPRRGTQLGQSLTEYVILVALIGTLGLWALQTLGSEASNAYCKVSNGFNAGGGAFYGMGRDDSGQLGNGSTGGPYDTPQKTELCGNFLAAGRNSSAAVSNAGIIYMWGGTDGYGELGPNTPTGGQNADTPIAVPLPASANGAVIQISMGLDFTAALTAGGQIYIWGINNEGELAQGCADVNAYSSGFNSNPALAHPDPTLIPTADFSGAVVQISAGNQAMYARTSAGTVYAWGNNDAGQLGQGSTGWPSIPQCGGGTNTTCECNATPVPVGLLGSNVEQITSMNSDSAYAIMTDGTVEAWGADEYGQLGDNQTGWFGTPRLVGSNGCPGGALQNVKDVRSGIYNAMALDASGNVYTWGLNQPNSNGSGGWWAYGGMLGNATSSDSECPVQPDGVNGNAHLDHVTLIGANNYGCFAEVDNVMYSWGSDANGELGYSAPSAGGGGLNGYNETVPTKAAALPTGVLGIGGGYGFTTMTYPPNVS